MPTISLHPPGLSRPDSSSASSLIPRLLQTPLGLAIMEIQGHINVPDPASEHEQSTTRVGRLVFPEYDATTAGNSEGPWMKKVYFYIGHQRMLGQVKKLPKPLGVVGRKGVLGSAQDGMHVDANGEELEILDIIKWKIVFNSRPEPVGENDED